MAEVKPATEKPAEKPAGKSEGLTEEESVNMQILKQKELLNNINNSFEDLKKEIIIETKVFNENRKEINEALYTFDYSSLTQNFDLYHDNAAGNAGGGAPNDKAHSGPQGAAAAANNWEPPGAGGEYTGALMINVVETENEGVNYNDFIQKDTRLAFFSNLIKSIPFGRFFRKESFKAAASAITGGFVGGGVGGAPVRGNVQKVTLALTLIAFIIMFVGIGITGGGALIFATFVIISLVSGLGLLDKMETQVEGTKEAFGSGLGAAHAAQSQQTDYQVEIAKKYASRGPSLFYELFNLGAGFVGQVGGNTEKIEFMRNTNFAKSSNQGVTVQINSELGPGKGVGMGLFAMGILLLFLILLCLPGLKALLLTKLIFGGNNLLYPLLSAGISKGKPALPILGSKRLPSVIGAAKGLKITTTCEDVQKSLEKINLAKNVIAEKKAVSELNKQLITKESDKKKKEALNDMIDKLVERGKKYSGIIIPGNIQNLLAYGGPNGGGEAALPVVVPAAPLAVGVIAGILEADDYNVGGVIYVGDYNSTINTILNDFNSKDLAAVNTKIEPLIQIGQRWEATRGVINTRRGYVSDAAAAISANGGLYPGGGPTTLGWVNFGPTTGKVNGIDSELKQITDSFSKYKSDLLNYYKTLKKNYDKEVAKLETNIVSKYETIENLALGNSDKSKETDEILREYILKIGIIVYDDTVAAPDDDYGDITLGVLPGTPGVWGTTSFLSPQPAAGQAPPPLLRYQVPIVDCYFRTIRDGAATANNLARKYSKQSYSLSTVKHIMGKAKILYLLEKYEKQERLLLPEKEKLKELEKMKKQLESSGLSLIDKLSGFKKDLKGDSEIVVKILKRNGLGNKIGVIKSAYGITVGAFLNLAKDTSMCGEIGKKYGFTSLENKAFVVSVKEVEEYYTNKTKEKEAEETKKEVDQKAKEDNKKAEETAKEAKKKTDEDKKKEGEKDKLTEDLKEEIKETNLPEGEKQKKLETLEKIEQIEKEQKEKEKIEDTESQIKIKQLELKTETDLAEIKKITNENDLTKKAINEVVKELQKSRRGSIEFTEHARELLIDHLGRLKKKREIQEKKLSDMVYEKERVSQLLTEMKKEEQFILQEKSQLEREKQQFREQQQKYLLDKAKMEQTIRQLQTRESNQKKRSLRKQNRPVYIPTVESGPPISYSSLTKEINQTSVNKGKIRTPQKRVSKPKQFTRKKPRREKKESFIESLTPDFLKSQ